MGFQDECYNYLNSNQFSVVTVDSIPMTEEAKVPTISAIPDGTVDFEKGYYHDVYVLLQFNKEDCVDRKEEKSEMEADTDE